MSLRSEVLKAFKTLHKTKNKVFGRDAGALNIVRQEINDNFRNNKAETNPEIIKQLIKDAYDADKDFKKVIQLEETSPGHYKAKLTEDQCVTDEEMLMYRKKLREKK